MSSSRKTKLPSSSPGASVARSGRYHLGEGWALHVGGMKRHALHAHHAYQVTCGIEGTVRLDDAVAPG